MTSRHVVVVGGGPAGALTAYLAASAGLRVTLIERHQDFEREFRGEVLMPSGLHMFERVGLKDAFERVPQHEIEGADLYWRAQRIRSFDFTGPRSISQPALLAMLVEEAGKFPGFRLRMGTGARGLLRDHGRVVGVETEDGPVAGDYVIGADGRFSALRRAAGLQAKGAAQSFDVVWGSVPGDGTACLRAYLGAGHLALAVPTAAGRLQVGWVVPKGGYGELKRQGFHAWVDEMSSHVDTGLASHLRAHRDEFEHPTLLSVVCNRLDEWSLPGLLLIGDAAHPMSPVGAQGINIALRDAVVVGNHVLAALASGAGPDAVDEAAKLVEDEREVEVRAIQDAQQRAPAFIFGATWRSRLAYWGFRLRIADLVLRFLARRFALGAVPVSYTGLPRHPADD